MGAPSLPTGKKLRMEIILTLIVKMIFLYLLWFLFFQEPDTPLPASQQFENHVFGKTVTPETSTINFQLLNLQLLNKEP